MNVKRAPGATNAATAVTNTPLGVTNTPSGVTNTPSGVTNQERPAGATNVERAAGAKNAPQALPWLAFYVCSRCEKVIQARLEEQGIESYVPIHTVVRQWSDRKKKVEEPLIRCYIFARPTKKQYYEVLSTDGVVRCITFGGQPAYIPDNQIEMLRILVSGQMDIEVVQGPLSPGQKVKFVTGPMAGFSGELIEIASKRKVVLRLDHIEQSFLITADPKLLQVIT